MKLNKGTVYSRLPNTSSGIVLNKGQVYNSVWSISDELALPAPVLTATQIGDDIYIEWQVG